MAEISTIARPYAEALMRSVRDSKDKGLAEKLMAALQRLGALVAEPTAREIINNPSLTSGQVFDLLRGLQPEDLCPEAVNLMKLLSENGRWEMVPEISRQFVDLLHQERSEAEAVIETPFDMDKASVDSLLVSLGKKFPGLKLLPKIVIDKSLIGGVRVTVGDKVIDGTVKARLAQMQEALTS